MKKETLLLINIIFIFTLASCATSQDNNEISLNSALNDGTSSFDEADYVKAEEFFSNALLIEKNNEIALKNKIITLNNLDKNTEALALAKEALVLYPDSIKFKLIEARLHRALDEEIEAIALYKEILEKVDSKTYHKEYIEYLTSLLPTENTLVRDSLLEESNYLINNYMCTEQALIALCTMDKTSLLYSLMLKEESSKAWNKIFAIENTENKSKTT